MVKTIIGLLIILFPICVVMVLCRMAKAGFAFYPVAIGTIVLSAHLAVIVGWYKLKSLAFPHTWRCPFCHEDAPLSGKQKCRKCGFRWDGHYFGKCPNCGGTMDIIHCPSCELSCQRPWWYEYWHKFN